MMKKRNAESYPGLSIQKRLLLLVLILIIPFASLSGYLIYNLNEIDESYDAIVQNITAVNNYNIVFRENMDSVMYMMVAHSLSKYEVALEHGMRRPDDMIRDAEEAFEKVRATTVSPDAFESIVRATKLLITLHKRVNDISTTVKETGYYDRNMESLEVNIYVLTEMIQDRISEYIYHESVSMDKIRNEMDLRRDMLVRFTLIFLAAYIVLAFLLVSGLTRSITRPVKNLVKAADQIGRGSFDVRAKESGAPEIRILARSFNSMAARIGELVEHNREEQIRLRDLELKLLQAQIDPHFLYNTLDNIVWLAEDDRKEDVEGIAAALSTFFRTALSGGRDEIPIREEERHIRSYLEIQQFRYSDILTYEINVAPECLDCLILKMTIQPVVENALYHGIKNKRGGGNISINIKPYGEQMRISVRDTGIGMSEEQLARLVQRVDGSRGGSVKDGHFGLSNVAERLRLNYGESSGLMFHSTYGEGTEVEIIIPRLIRSGEGKNLTYWIRN
ncbi:MAG: sensor histidine kinase [Lachnospiraceae bacterium]|nr:sensor histidine kinase [Lachnospiraceae bacterium]